MSEYGNLSQPAELRLIPAPPLNGRNRWRAVCTACGWMTRPMRYDAALQQRDNHDVAHFGAALGTLVK